MTSHKELRRLKKLAKHQDKISSVKLVENLNETLRKNETPRKNEQNGSIFSFLTNLVGFASPKANQKQTKADPQGMPSQEKKRSKNTVNTPRKNEQNGSIFSFLTNLVGSFFASPKADPQGMPPQKEIKSALFAQDKQAGKDEQNESIFSFLTNLVGSLTSFASPKADKKVTPKENRNVKKGLFSSLKPVGILGTIGVALWAMVKNENIGAAVTSNIVSQCINELTTFASVLINKLSELGQSLSKLTGIELNWKSWETATQLQVKEVTDQSHELSQNIEGFASDVSNIANTAITELSNVENPSSVAEEQEHNTFRSN